MYALPISSAILFLLLSHSQAYAQGACAMDGFGKVYCAPPGGTAVETLTGVVVCSPGNCETDYSGYLKCSRELNGGAIKDAFGKVVCVGGCVNPIIDYCVVPK